MPDIPPPQTRTSTLIVSIVDNILTLSIENVSETETPDFKFEREVLLHSIR